jgi:hypothetical protein
MRHFFKLGRNSGITEQQLTAEIQTAHPPPEGYTLEYRKSLSRDLVDLIAVVAVSAGCVAILTLVCALAVSLQ